MQRDTSSITPNAGPTLSVRNDGLTDQSGGQGYGLVVAHRKLKIVGFRLTFWYECPAIIDSSFLLCGNDYCNLGEMRCAQLTRGRPDSRATGGVAHAKSPASEFPQEGDDGAERRSGQGRTVTGGAPTSGQRRSVHEAGE